MLSTSSSLAHPKMAANCKFGRSAGAEKAQRLEEKHMLTSPIGTVLRIGSGRFGSDGIVTDRDRGGQLLVASPFVLAHVGANVRL